MNGCLPFSYENYFISLVEAFKDESFKNFCPWIWPCQTRFSFPPSTQIFIYKHFYQNRFDVWCRCEEMCKNIKRKNGKRKKQLLFILKQCIIILPRSRSMQWKFIGFCSKKTLSLFTLDSCSTSSSSSSSRHHTAEYGRSGVFKDLYHHFFPHALSCLCHKKRHERAICRRKGSEWEKAIFMCLHCRMRFMRAREAESDKEISWMFPGH